MLISILFAILIGLSMVYPSIYILHMYQQNRYEIGRYHSWIKANVKIILLENFTTIGATILIVAARFLESYEVLTIWILTVKIIVDYVRHQKKIVIKPLKYTPRVKRQVGGLIILDTLVVLTACIAVPRAWLFIVIIVALWLHMFTVTIVMFLLNPLEMMFHKRFMHGAHQLLNQSPNLKIIGITGSYGKTSSKNVLQQLLSSKYYSLMTPESFNTPMGITLTIKNQLKSIHQVFICEMGADHVGDIEELMNFVRPQYGIVTSIGPQHLTTFKTQENIITEKMKAIELLPKGGIGILNMDNAFIRQYEVKNKDIALIKVGILCENCDYRAVNISYTNTGSSFDVLTKDDKRYFETSLLGGHNIMNILVAIAMGDAMGIDYDCLYKAVKHCPFIEHRLEIKTINGFKFIDNAFNSNPSGATMSLEVLSMMPNRRFIITPGMIDLGNEQDQYNYAFGKQMLNKVDYCILVGENQTKHIYRGLQDAGFDMANVSVVPKVKDAFDIVYKLASTEDTILLENDLPDAFNN